MPLRRALQVAAPIADGLAKAHEAGIVHRDLKPENLMVSHDGFAKILDFGLAKLVGDAEARAALQTMTEKGTRPGSVMGTVDYMSPEQASGGTADNRSDQFSFGLVLYEMLTGRRAFNGPTAVETLSAIIRDDADANRATQSVSPGAGPVDRRPVSGEEPGGSVRVHARSGAGSGERARSFFRVDELRRDSRVGRRACCAGQKAGTRRVVARRNARDRRGWPDGPPQRAAASGLGPDRPLHDRAAGESQLRVELCDVAIRRFARRAPSGIRRRQTPTGRAGSGSSRSIRSCHGRCPGPKARLLRSGRPMAWHVGFFTENRLKRVSIAGGDVATICEARFRRRRDLESRRRDRVRAGVDGALFRVAATGGTPTPVTVLDPAREESGHLSAAVPAGRPSLRVRDFRRRQRGHLRGVARFT